MINGRSEDLKMDAKRNWSCLSPGRGAATPGRGDVAGGRGGASWTWRCWSMTSCSSITTTRPLFSASMGTPSHAATYWTFVLVHHLAWQARERCRPQHHAGIHARPSPRGGRRSGSAITTRGRPSRSSCTGTPPSAAPLPLGP
jgi:hypothetical protein